MKKRKLFLGVLLASAAFSFTACGNNSKSDDIDDQVQTDETKYTVTFDSNGGSNVSSVEVVSGGKVTRPNNPTKTATAAETYTFAGWYKDQALTAEFNFDIETITAATTIYAKWTATPVEYVVTFNYNNGDAATTVNVNYNSTISRPTDPTKANEGNTKYAFAGWYTNEACTESFDFATPITGAISLYAKWEATDKVSVIFDSNGGSSVDTQLVFPGEKATAPTAPTKTATAAETYTFAGWYKDAELQYAFDFDNDTITEAITLYAKWTATPVEYVVTFNYNNGDSATTVNVNYGETVTRPTDPTKANEGNTKYAFAGWYTNEACTDSFDFATPITGAVSLYAKWEATDKVSVIFNTNGGSSVTTQLVFPGEKATRPTTNPTKTATAAATYTFAGWYADSACTQEYDFNAEITTTTTIYAKWDSTPVEYLVMFQTYFGTEIDNQSIAYGQHAVKPADPTKDGDETKTYTFAGWYKDSKCTQAYDFETEIITEATTIYAKWTETPVMYTVTFDSNGGSDVSSQSVAYGSKLTKPGDPAKENTSTTKYVFAGWYKDSNFQYSFDFDNDTITESMTLYAKWNSYDKIEVVFDSYGGTYIESQIVYVGEKVTKPETDPTRASTNTTKYVFAGWYTDYTYNTPFDFENTVIEGPTTICAKWDSIGKVVVTFEPNGLGYIDSQSVFPGDKLTKPEDPTRSYSDQYVYTFVGWCTDEECTQLFDFDNDTVSAAMTLYGKWTETIRKHIVVFVYEDLEISRQEVEYGKKVEKPTDPTREASESCTYEFRGWSKYYDLYDEFDFDNDVIKSSTTLYANFTAIPYEYTVSFNTNGGSEVSSQTVEHYGYVEKPADPTKAADSNYTYEFAGWYKDSGLSQEFDFDNDFIEGPTTIYAKWYQTSTVTPEPDKFVVSFDSNGGSSVAPIQVEDGGKISAPTAPTKSATAAETYTFAGWYKDSALQNAFDFDNDTITDSITLYAKWTATPIEFTVTFNSNGGTTVDSQSVAYGSLVDEPTAPTKAADVYNTYEFAGWFTDSGLTTEYNFNLAVTSAFTLYAKWDETPVEYLVSFNSNGGTSIDSQTLTYGETVTRPVDPTKEDTETETYEFAGWYSDSSLNSLYDFSTEVHTTFTLYAKWTATPVEYTITFNTNGGTAVDSQSVAYGQKVTTPTAPTKAADADYEYEFAGWYIDSGLTQAYDFNSTVTSAFTLYAKWTATPTGDVETENVGFGGSYTSWQTLFDYTGSTRTYVKDNKTRTYLGPTSDDELITMNGFTFLGKALLDSGVLNTNASVIKIQIPNNGSSINMSATWGSTNNIGVIRVYKDGVMIYESSDTYSKTNSSVTLTLTDLDAGTYEIKAEKTDADGQAGLKISTIYYSRIVEKVTVSYVTNNNQTIENTTIRKGNTLDELPTLNDKSGYRFIGWYTTADFQEGTEFTTSTVVNANTTIYAKWEELTAEDIVTISFNINVNGQTIEPVEIEKGTKLSALPVLNISGYRLEGWFTTSTFSQAFNVDTYTFNVDTTLYAEYIKIYNVTFLDNDGNLIKTVTVDTDTKVTESITIPYIEGYKFSYWKNTSNNQEFDITEEYIAADYTLQAVYEIDTNPVEKVSITSTQGYEESANIVFSTYKNSSNQTADSYNVYLNGTVFNNQLLTASNVYMTTSGTTVNAELFGLKAGTYTVTVAPVFNESELTAARQTATFSVTAYDRSGYAHFNNTEGVGAYNDDGTLKDNAIVLYVTDANKNTINLSFHDNVNNKDWSVTGIGNILNSAGKDNGSGTNSKGGLANTNGGVILALAQNNIPLVVRFVGCVSNSGLYKQGTFNANSTPLIQGLSQYDGIDWGGSVGDNGHMARMQSGKNITFEGVGNDAIIDGWGFHLICESAHPELAKNFEVRNLTFMNTPEDAVGMEGQETESTQTITAAVEHCWVHHNTFLAPSISSPAESDKSEGDGSCDFKRGRYFTCSYNYFENCHKTNLVGSGKTSVQYCLTYHHNLWYQCAARQPLARKANIHFYNNFIIGTSDTVSSLRADCYMFAEKNYYLGCSRPVEYKAEGTTGVCKAYENNVIGCFNNYDATEVTDREQTITANCKDNATGIDYSTFDTDSTKFYYDATNKTSDCYLTDANQARIDCVEQAGSRYRTKGNNCEYKTSTDITSTASSSTISGATSLTIAKGKGILKVFTVTTPVTVTMAATASAGFDTGYLLKMDGSVVLELTSSNQTAVLMPGEYVIMSCIAFTPTGKNDKETTITTCTFAEYDSEELNQQLLAQYQAAHDVLPTTVQYTDEHYQLIKAAMNAYNALGTELQSQISNYADVTSAYEAYKTAGETYVEGLINQIVLPVTASNSAPILTARAAYNVLVAKISDATVSNYSTLTTAEAQMSELAVDIFLNAVSEIPSTITYTLACNNAISNAEAAYANLDENQVKISSVVTAYNTMVAARATYEGLGEIAEVDEMISSVSLSGSKAELKAVMDAYAELSSAQQAQIADANKYNSICAKYVDLLINEIPATITYSDIAIVTAARTAYNALTSTQQALVTNYSTLTAAEAAVEDLGIQSLDSYSTSDFSTEWTITGSTSSTTNGLVGDIYTGNTITAVSKFMLSSISQVSGNIYVSDKGTTTITVYTTSDLDSDNWTQIAAFTSKNNSTDTPVSATVSVSGPVYVKIVMTCTKGSGKTTKLNSISFE